MKHKSMLAGLVIALGLAAGSAHAQILQNLENAITGTRPSQAESGSVRRSASRPVPPPS